MPRNGNGNGNGNGRGPGQPTKLTDHLRKLFVDSIKAGNYYEPSCALVGIHYATFRRWMVDGEKASTGQYHEFYEEVMCAESEAEIRVVAQWNADIKGNPQAARDFLARRHPDRWGPKEKTELSGPGGGPVEVSGDEALIRKLNRLREQAKERGDETTGGEA